MLFHQIEEQVGGFDIADQRSAPVPCEDVEREQHQQVIGRDGAAQLIDGAHAVAIAIERDTELMRAGFYGRLQCGERVRVGRVGVVVRERAIGFEEQARLRALDGFQQRFDDGACRAVSGVPCDADLFEHRLVAEGAQDGFDIFIEQLHFLALATRVQ